MFALKLSYVNNDFSIHLIDSLVVKNNNLAWVILQEENRTSNQKNIILPVDRPKTK